MTARLPSLLDNLATVRPRLEPPSLIALDFDGTLTEIVDDPGAPRLTPERRAVLSRLSATGRRLAIVSGRALPDVRARVGVGEAIYVGNHGLEIEGPDVRERAAGAEDLEARLTELLDRLSLPERTFVEDKQLTATIHVRPRDDERRIDAVGEALAGAVEAAGLVLRRGKASWEIRPPGPHTKGAALRRLLALTPEASEARTLYAGDDATDEDAFRAIPGGVTARVGKPTVETSARWALPSPTAVYAFLEGLIER